MADKVCPNGHVYVGNKCVRDNWEETAEVKAVETPDTSETLADVKDEETVVPKAKAIKKAVKKVAKKKGKK